jgi:hypothetical protein
MRLDFPLSKLSIWEREINPRQREAVPKMSQKGGKKYIIARFLFAVTSPNL